MQIINDPGQMQKTAEDLRMKHQLIAVVMTMGALHEGHLKLVDTARRNAGSVILTIFVNPRQFGENEDFHRYPRPFEKDAAMAKAAGVDYLFAPDAMDMYPEGFQTTVSTGSLGRCFEGQCRPGHFDGMATVVLKLFNITRPHIAVFGEKDAQQLAVIRRMVQDFNINVTILETPLMREQDGLAISSRNIYLSLDERRQAAVLSRALHNAQQLIDKGTRSCRDIVEAAEAVIRSAPAATIEYACIVDNDTFEEVALLTEGREYRMLLAVNIGRTRLIDNRKYSL